MATMTQNYTAQEWAEHEQFVQMFRAAKQRKREWQSKMEVLLAEKAEKPCPITSLKTSCAWSY